MSVVSAEKLMHSPPGTVFDLVAAHHFENHPRWDPDVLEMNQTSPGTVGVGTKANIVRRQGNRRVEGTATVTEYQPDQSAAWVCSSDLSCYANVSSWRRTKVELRPAYGCQSRPEPRD